MARRFSLVLVRCHSSECTVKGRELRPMRKPRLVFALSLSGLLFICASTSVFAGDSSKAAAKTSCPSGYTQTAQGCVRSDLVESHDVGFPAGPPQPNELCHKDSDCPNGAVCVSCKTVLDYLSPVQCPPDKSFCEMAPKSQSTRGTK